MTNFVELAVRDTLLNRRTRSWWLSALPARNPIQACGDAVLRANVRWLFFPLVFVGLKLPTLIAPLAKILKAERRPCPMGMVPAIRSASSDCNIHRDIL